MTGPGKQSMAPRCQSISRRTFHRLAGATIGSALAERMLHAQANPTSVVLLLTGVVTDGGWSQLAYEGLEKLRARGFKTAYAENIGLAQIQEVARGYADDGFDLVIGHGFEFSSALLDVAPDYPRQHFFVTSYLPEPRVPSNILFVNMGYFDAAYAAGALAALISERKHAVGFVGGEDDPTQLKMKRAFIAGAEHTVAGVKGLAIITGDYNNAAKGREAASTLVGNGADVIWHAADITGLGAIQGAAAAKVKVLGCYSDQSSLAPDYVAASFQLNLSYVVATLGEEVASHTYHGGTDWRPSVDKMWLLKAGGYGDHNPRLVSPAAWTAFQKIWSGLAARTIDVGSIVDAG